jgi:hypothetical protein
MRSTTAFGSPRSPKPSSPPPAPASGRISCRR